MKFGSTLTTSPLFGNFCQPCASQNRLIAESHTLRQATIRHFHCQGELRMTPQSLIIPHSKKLTTRINVARPANRILRFPPTPAYGGLLNACQSLYLHRTNNVIWYSVKIALHTITLFEPLIPVRWASITRPLYHPRHAIYVRQNAGSRVAW